MPVAPRGVSSPRPALAAVLLALALSLASSPVVAAEPLLPDGGTQATLRGVGRERGLTLGRAALADLRKRDDALVGNFPLGADRAADLELQRFDPFTPGARVEVVSTDGTHKVALPDNTYFRGT